MPAPPLCQKPQRSRPPRRAFVPRCHCLTAQSVCGSKRKKRLFVAAMRRSGLSHSIKRSPPGLKYGRLAMSSPMSPLPIRGSQPRTAEQYHPSGCQSKQRTSILGAAPQLAQSNHPKRWSRAGGSFSGSKKKKRRPNDLASAEPHRRPHGFRRQEGTSLLLSAPPSGGKLPRAETLRSVLKAEWTAQLYPAGKPLSRCLEQTKKRLAAKLARW